MKIAAWLLLRPLLGCALIILFVTRAYAEPSPSVVGWGNVLVPGLGATLRGDASRGLIEAGTEVGLYYGGTFGAREGTFTVDGSVLVPQGGNVYRPLLGQILQQFGLKLHMYDTFYNYQQSAISFADSEREKSNPQLLYKGSWIDELEAPFRWNNLSSPWVYSVILASGAYLFYTYATTTVPNLHYTARPIENTLYGFSQIGAIPIGSALGEESFFRGFIQRETRLYTNSALVSILAQTSLFTLIHPAELRPVSFISGIYFGIMVNHFNGNLEQAIAAHFWINVLDGLVTFWQFRRTQGVSTPFNPPIAAQLVIPF